MKSLARMVLAILVSLMMPAASSADVRLLDAVLQRDRNAVRQLLKNHVDVNAAQPDGSTALMLAAERNDVEIADLLIRARANVNATNEYGGTALSVACAGGNLALIRLLLDAHADPNAPLRSGETPLMTAVDNGNRDAANVGEQSPPPVAGLAWRRPPRQGSVRVVDAKRAVAAGVGLPAELQVRRLSCRAWSSAPPRPRRRAIITASSLECAPTLARTRWM